VRLNRLELMRYGPSQDHALDSVRWGRRSVVAVVYGVSEAGKSAAFMAWLDFMFGFHDASPYVFRFERRDLMVGAEIETPDVPQRLRATDANNLVAEERMARWLHGLGREAYRTRFSPNDLREGGKNIAQAQATSVGCCMPAPRVSSGSRARWRRSRAR
jgi:chromosome segregation protein